jgi:prevent-host-death family protein
MNAITTNTIGAYDAKTHFSSLLERVVAGEEFTITKHGLPVAKLVPVKPQLTPAERQAIIDDWKENSKGLSLGGLSIRALIEEGRR